MADQISSFDIAPHLDAVAELLRNYDGSPVDRSLIRRAVLRSILHLPPDHGASEALELFYETLEKAAPKPARQKARAKPPKAINVLEIWSHARKAIETVTAKAGRG